MTGTVKTPLAAAPSKVKVVCDGCQRDKPVRRITLVMASMLVCQECFKKLQKARMAPQNWNWDGSHT